MSTRSYDVDYKYLKSSIIKSCRQNDNDDVISFYIIGDKLSKLTSDENCGLRLLPIGLESKPITPESIINISEYFKDKKLSWFTDDKEYTQIIFVKEESIDDKAQELIDQLVSDDYDKVNAVATLVAEYPCYFATIIAYENNGPIRFGKPSYMIGCRANTITITQNINARSSEEEE